MDYLVVDITELEKTRVLLKTDLERAPLWARLFALRSPQKLKIKGPAIRGSALSAYCLEELQYLYWNTFQKTPCDNYGELIVKILVEAEKMEKDETAVSTLQKEIAVLEEELDEDFKETKIKIRKQTSSPSEKKSDRPVTGTTTGAVWDICDELCVSLKREPTRKEAIDKCIYDGVNKATASTQFSKWKKWKEVQNNS